MVSELPLPHGPDVQQADPRRNVSVPGAARVMIIDLGRAYVDASPETMMAEMRWLRSLLRQ